MDNFEIISNPQGSRQPVPRWLAILGAASVIVLIVGLITWMVNRGSDDTAGSQTADDQTTMPMPTDPGTNPIASSTPGTDAPAETTTSVFESSTSPSTTTTAPATTTTTVVPTGPSGEQWIAHSELFTDPIPMSRIAQDGDINVYEGLIDQGGFEARCVVIAATGEGAWTEACIEADTAFSFVALDGIDPLFIEVGASLRQVTISRQPPTWSLPTNGCTASISTLIAAAELGGAVATGLVCVGDEAFMGYSSVWLQPGPVDGGGLLLVNGTEGWNTDGGGTSISCNQFPDGVDRCVSFDVDDEMFDALLAIPPSDALTANTDIVNVIDETGNVRTWLDGEIDPAAIEAIILAQLIDPDAEGTPTVRRSDGIQFESANLLQVEVPALDDSIRSTTWAIWISVSPDGFRPPIIRATSWNTCARGLADEVTCV